MRTDSKGLTIIELLLALALFAVVVMVTAQILFSYLRVNAAASAANEVNQNLRLIANRLERSAHSATGIFTPATAGGTASELKFGGGSCDIPAEACYSLTSAADNPPEALRIDESTGAPETITTGSVRVTAFTATRLDNGSTKSVKIVVTVRYAGTAQVNYEKTLELIYALRG